MNIGDDNVQSKTNKSTELRLKLNSKNTTINLKLYYTGKSNCKKFDSYKYVSNFSKVAC